MSLSLKPITLAEAKAYVESKHRNHKAPLGHKMSIGVIDDKGDLRGCVVVGRPVARALDDGFTAEVTRCCTDGARNACSLLYGAAARAAKAVGYKKIYTYTLKDEGGASLRGAGWICEGEMRSSGKGWSNQRRLDLRGAGCVREENHPQAKVRWCRVLRV